MLLPRTDRRFALAAPPSSRQRPTIVTAIIASLTTLDRLSQVPSSTWIIIGLVIGGILLAVPIIRKILEISGIWILFALFISSVLIGAHWVYHRSEPAVLSPLVDFVAPFFPKKAVPKK